MALVTKQQQQQQYDKTIQPYMVCAGLYIAFIVEGGNEQCHLTYLGMAPYFLSSVYAL